MPSSDFEAAIRRAERRIRRSLAADIANLRADAGVSRTALAAASGVDRRFLDRIEEGDARASLLTYQRLAAGLGASLSVRLYPNTGPNLRDRWAAPMLELLLASSQPRWRPFPEVAVRQPGRGWIDVALHDERERVLVAAELQSELRRLEQLIRWHALKADSLPSWEGWPHLHEAPDVSRLLVVRRTRATRQLATEFAHQLRAAYPAHPDDAIAALGGTAPWPGAAMAWMIVDARGARWVAGR